MSKKVKFIFIVEGGKRGSTESQYFKKLFDYYHPLTFEIINRKGITCPKIALKEMQKHLNKDKTGFYKNYRSRILKPNIIPCVIMDTDENTKFNGQLKACYQKENIILFLSNRSFEHWIEMHRSNKCISQKLSTDRKIEFFKYVQDNLCIKDSIDQAYQRAHLKCQSANDTLSDPFCSNYSGSDLFALIDLIKQYKKTIQ